MTVGQRLHLVVNLRRDQYSYRMIAVVDTIIGNAVEKQPLTLIFFSGIFLDQCGSLILQIPKKNRDGTVGRIYYRKGGRSSR